MERHFRENITGSWHCICRVVCIGHFAFRLVGMASTFQRLIPKHSDGETQYSLFKKEAGHGITDMVAASALFKSCILLQHATLMHDAAAQGCFCICTNEYYDFTGTVTCS